ncbi:MAG: hypothetical protein R2698_02960 [Microthrixaceae bacterium]
MHDGPVAVAHDDASERFPPGGPGRAESRPRTLRYEGFPLETVLERVQRDHGADVTIIAAERVRKGGLWGFFQQEVFQVTVTTTPNRHRPSVVVEYDDRLLDGLDPDDVEGALALDIGPAAGDEEIWRLMSEVAARAPDPHEAWSPGSRTGGDPEPAGDGASVPVPEAGSDRDSSDPVSAIGEPTPPTRVVGMGVPPVATPASLGAFLERSPEMPTGLAATLLGSTASSASGVASSGAPTFEPSPRPSQLAAMALPMDIGDPAPITVGDDTGVASRRPPTPTRERKASAADLDLPERGVVAIVGDDVAASTVVHRLLRRGCIRPEDVVACAASAPAERERVLVELHRRADAAHRGAASRVVIAVELTTGRSGHEWVRSVLGVVSPTQTRFAGTADALLGPQRMSIAAIGTVDTVDLLDAPVGAGPDTYEHLRVPISTVDGRVADEEGWRLAGVGQPIDSEPYATAADPIPPGSDPSDPAPSGPFFVDAGSAPIARVGPEAHGPDVGDGDTIDASAPRLPNPFARPERWIT